MHLQVVTTWNARSNSPTPKRQAAARVSLPIRSTMSKNTAAPKGPFRRSALPENPQSQNHAGLIQYSEPSPAWQCREHTTRPKHWARSPPPPSNTPAGPPHIKRQAKLVRSEEHTSKIQTQMP